MSDMNHRERVCILEAHKLGIDPIPCGKDGYKVMYKIRDTVVSKQLEPVYFKTRSDAQKDIFFYYTSYKDTLEFTDTIIQPIIYSAEDRINKEKNDIDKCREIVNIMRNDLINLGNIDKRLINRKWTDGENSYRVISPENICECIMKAYNIPYKEFD